MAEFFLFLFLSSLAIWMGSIAFYGFIATPDVSGNLPKEQALRILSRMSLPYLHLTWVCATVAFFSSFFLKPLEEGSVVTARIALVGVMFGLALYLAFASGARVRTACRGFEAADAGDLPADAVKAFDDFCGSSGQLNGALLLLGTVVLFITAFYS